LGKRTQKGDLEIWKGDQEIELSKKEVKEDTVVWAKEESQQWNTCPPIHKPF
jgi:hypothetical protein